MPRQRPDLGTPFGADGPWLAAILDVLGDICDMLDARLPEPTHGDGEPVPISEPAPDKPGEAVPVKEPAPATPPKRNDDDEGGPVKIAEPAPSREPPPRAGRGASEAAWRAYAETVEVAVPDGAGRDDIIAACEQAGVIASKE